MTLDAQPRETNGQYGHKNHSAPEVPLAEEVDGSFLFPPNNWPGGAEQYLHFWKTQPISDEAMTNFASAYAAKWDAWADPQVDEHLHLWGNSEEARQIRNTHRGDADTLWRYRDAEQARFYAELEANRPRRIPTSTVRYVARAAQIIDNLGSLPPEEQAEAEQAEMYVTNGGHPWSARGLWEGYELHQIMPDAFYSRNNAVEKQMRDLRAQLANS
jgi:hypothetical protein